MSTATRTRRNNAVEFPLEDSIGALIRLTHRAFAEDLQTHLSAHEVNVGMWYFLRSLWEEDGITQRELSRRVGVSEPTTLQQLRKMETEGLIERCPSTADRRKMHVHLTRYGRALRRKLLPYARDVNAAGLDGFSANEISELRTALNRIRHNLQRREATRAVSPNPAGAIGET